MFIENRNLRMDINEGEQTTEGLESAFGESDQGVDAVGGGP